METMNLNEMAATVHAANIKWWQDLETGKPIERNRGQLLMLVITELAEAVEGIRKNLMDDKLPRRKMEEVEMADAFIRLLDYAGGFNIKIVPLSPLEVFNQHGEKSESILGIVRTITTAWVNGTAQSFHISLANATRQDHQHESRKAANGKKF